MYVRPYLRAPLYLFAYFDLVESRLFIFYLVLATAPFVPRGYVAKERIDKGNQLSALGR
jgi:hypothetical protein